MKNDPVWAHFNHLAEEGVWASLYQPGVRIDAENFSFLIRARRVMELLRLRGKQPQELLDVGCGTAPLGPAIVAMGSHYTGIDFSPEMIEAARRLMTGSEANGSARLSVGDATNLEAPDAAFDATVAMGLIEYFSRDDVSRVMGEIARVTKPGGVAIVTIPKRWHWGRVIDLIVTPFRRSIRWRPGGPSLRLRRQEGFQRLFLTCTELDEAARKAGLHKAGQRHYNAQVVCGPVIWLFPRLAYLMNRPFESLALIPGGSFFATGYIGMYTRK